MYTPMHSTDASEGRHAAYAPVAAYASGSAVAAATKGRLASVAGGLSFVAVRAAAAATEPLRRSESMLLEAAAALFPSQERNG